MAHLDAATVHLNFITSTDVKSFHNQMKKYVKIAQYNAQKELERRRNKLKNLVQLEEDVYEQEFILKTKTRQYEHIKERFVHLQKVQAAAAQQTAENLSRIKLKRQIENCHETRAMLRCQETEMVQQVQLHQMADQQHHKERADEDKYWLELFEKSKKEADMIEAQERCLKKKLAMANRRVLEQQMKEQQNALAAERAAKTQERWQLTRDMGEEHEKHVVPAALAEYRRKRQYGKELLEMAASKKMERSAEKCAHDEYMREVIAKAQREEVDELYAKNKQKSDFGLARQAEIHFTRGLRHIQEEEDKLRQQSFDEVYRIDSCAKRDWEPLKRANDMVRWKEDNRKQRSEESRRRTCENLEHLENRILDNVFVKNEPTAVELAAKRLKNREIYEQQIAETKKLRIASEAMEKLYMEEAEREEAVCKEVGELVTNKPLLHRKLHPNWLLLAEKQAQASCEKDAQGRKAAKDEGLLNECARKCVLKDQQAKIARLSPYWKKCTK